METRTKFFTPLPPATLNSVAVKRAKATSGYLKEWKQQLLEAAKAELQKEGISPDQVKSLTQPTPEATQPKKYKNRKKK